MNLLVIVKTLASIGAAALVVLILLYGNERQSIAQEERQPIAQEEAENKKRDDDLKQCLQAAEEAYSANWDRACRQIDGPPKCILPPLVLARFDGPRRSARDECAKLYPVK